MYDSKNEAHEFTADNRANAIRKAVDYFGVGVEELRIAEFPAGAVYGLGGRAVVVASLLNRTPPPPGRSGGRDEGGRNDRPRRDSSGSEGRGSGRRGDRGDRGGRGGRGGRDSHSEDSAPIRSEARRPERSEDRAPAAAPTEASVGTTQGEVGEIGKFLLGAVERMDLGPFEISENAEGDLLVYELRGAAADSLAGGDGRTVDALQLLANQVAQRLELDARIVLDIEGNTNAREEFMAGLAERAARRARKTQRAVALDPMNGRDRRMIHIALRDVEDVATMSVGEGRYRQVMIAPEGAPEFEQARKESASARSDEAR